MTETHATTSAGPMRQDRRASILIPVYNSASTLDRCLASARAQTLTDIEILVADDASTDGSGALAERHAAADDRVRVIRLTQNGGKPRAMNLMMAQARGAWVAVLDADDAFAETRLEHLIAAAEKHGVDMAADNLFYLDAGVTDDGPHGTIVRTAFDRSGPDRVISLPDMIAASNTFGDFDYGILKPVIRRSFVEAHRLTYYEKSRLAEDFTYLLTYFVAGGQMLLSSEPLYLWTLPFGVISREWTKTGAGPWRYNYREALLANAHFIAQMKTLGLTEVVRMLERRSRQYSAMIPYLDAQKLAGQQRYIGAAALVARHPACWRLLGQRVVGRAIRALRPTQQFPA